MYNFRNDYSEGAHPSILNKLIATNLEQQLGYGEDEYSLQAKAIIKRKINNDAAKVYFVSGGTQTNLLVIAALLKIHEAVISADTGHIYVHETGAIESIGHRVITVETTNGKLTPALIQNALNQYTLRPHVVKPKLIYISNVTEIGTIYSKQELQALYQFCKTKELFLFMDGARLGHALTADSNDLSLADIAAMTDVFYIGGTKNGALLGEAIVFNNPDVVPEFDYVLKQKGALLAKGRILGIQFLELFKDDLYFQLARHANDMAGKLVAAFEENGVSFLMPPASNQIFPILSKSIINKLSEKYLFYEWKVIDDHLSAIRLITSWATDAHQVEAFISDLNACQK